jgi:hypothetical protein
MDKKSHNPTKQVDVQVVGKAPDHGWQCRAEPSMDPILVKPN